MSRLRIPPAQIARWQASRRKGLAHYVLVHGVLAYGLPVFVVMTFVLLRGPLTPRFVLVSALLWHAGGALFGLAMWFVQRHYLREAGVETD